MAYVISDIRKSFEKKIKTLTQVKVSMCVVSDDVSLLLE